MDSLKYCRLKIVVVLTTFQYCSMHVLHTVSLHIPGDLIMEGGPQNKLIELIAVNATVTFENGTIVEDKSPDGDSMSVMWYLVSFGGLVLFFLLLSFSEFCCKRKGTIPSPRLSNAELPAPPPYDLFAPPSYDSLFRDINRKRSIRASVFLIPIHEKAELPLESPLEFGEVIRRNPMGDGEVVTPPPPP